ncbi:MAG: hypothetical protein IPM50_04940 [Acidobacteriota bacterium]|nr:MAG: hypothetical protein IPM50_04940 [Acidobacteriota bacterium]
MAILITALGLLAVIFSCDAPKEPVAEDGPRNSSPTEAYKNLFDAVKAKDTEAIKRNLTKKSIDMGQMMVDRKMKDSVAEALENGLTATTLSPTLPTIRDERVKGNMGALEVWNSKDSKWEDLPFMLENGSWKLAWGDQFAGTFVSPGKGRDTIEKEAANAMSNTPSAAVHPAVTNSAAANAVNGAAGK